MLKTKPAMSTPRRSRRSKPAAAALGLTIRTPTGELVHDAPPDIAGSLRSMVARLRVNDELPERIGITSAIRGEGVTSVCRSLGVVLAHDSATRVCIVDLNWWAPAPWPAPLDPAGGLAEVLSGRLPLADALVATDSPRLFVLPAGEPAPAERPALAGSPALDAVLRALGTRFDHVVLDLPAIYATSEALMLARHAGALALVVRQGVTSEGQIKAALEEVEGVPMLGVILNASSIKVPGPILRRFPSV